MLVPLRLERLCSSTSAHLRGATLASALASTLGCGEILGVSDYRVRPETSDASGASDAALQPPILPARPDEGRVDDCTACVEANCADEREVCLGSERCRDMLWCTSECSDPSCIAECEDAHPDSSYSPYFRDYFNCAFSTWTIARTSPAPVTACLEACGAGQNWECLGQFLWGTVPSDHPTVHVQLYDLLGVLGDPAAYPGYEVTACADGPELDAPPGDLGCAVPWLEVSTYGAVEMPFIGDGDRRGTSIAIRNSGAGVRERVYTRPILRDAFLPVFANGGLGFLDWIDGFNMPHDDKLGIVIVVQHDCLGIGAAADVELADPGVSVRRCVEGADLFTGTLTDCTNPTNGAIFTNVSPSSRVSLTSFLPTPGSRREVSRRGNLLAAARWYTAVHLYPLDSTGR